MDLNRFNYRVKKNAWQGVGCVAVVLLLIQDDFVHK